MTISETVLHQARAIVAQPGFRDEPLHQIGKTAYFVVSAPEYGKGFEKKGEITVESCDYPIVFVPRTY